MFVTLLQDYMYHLQCRIGVIVVSDKADHAWKLMYAVSTTWNMEYWVHKKSLTVLQAVNIFTSSCYQYPKILW